MIGIHGDSSPLRTVLAFDCAAGACSAAVWRQGAIAAGEFRPMARGHAEILLPMIERTMSEAGIAYADLDAIAVTVGPGAFTGLRIALAAALGIGLAAGRPVIGVGTLQALAAGVRRQAPRDGEIAAVIDNKRAGLYAQRFGPDLAPRSEPAVLSPEGFAAALPDCPVLAVGDGAPALALAATPGRGIAFAPGPGLPDAAHVAWLVAEGPSTARLAPVLLYMQAPAVTPAPTLAPTLAP
jgi:tRNA threonylcarbamoyladenosine biosynthesis protein TsaB